MGTTMTTGQVKRIIQLNGAGCPTSQIADEVGASRDQVRRWLKKLGHKPSGCWADYSIYNDAGELIAFGTSKQCAEQLGVKQGTIYQKLRRAKVSGDGRAVREDI